MHKTPPIIPGRWRINADDLPVQRQDQRDCVRQCLPEQLGVGYSSIFQLEQDLSYIETHYAPVKNLAVLSRTDFDQPRMVVTLGLKGNSRFCGNSGDEVVFQEGYTAITTFNSSMGERHYQADNTVTQLRLSLSKRWLERHFEESHCAHLFRDKSIQQRSLRPISQQGLIAAQQLLASNESTKLSRVFMHGQALLLLAAELRPLCEENLQGAKHFSQQDVKMAKLARDILVTEYQNPPSVEQLSKRVGTNQFKLKQLFHHFFNNTPYGLLLEIRMNTAYRLLESTRCQVSVAADRVGYRHASNFSAAFTQYFGVSPKSISKKS